MSSLARHAWYIGLKQGIDAGSGTTTGQQATYDTSADSEGNVYHMARGTSFEGEPDIETEDYEANCGQATTFMGKERVSASSSPTWEQKAVFGEFFEEGCYMLLGKKTTTEVSITPIEGESITTAYRWTFDSGDCGLPLATIKNSYFENGGDTMIYRNAKMSTWEMDFDDKGVNLTFEFGSDVVSPNNPNPSEKNIPFDYDRLGTKNFKVYIGDYGSDLFDITTHTPKEGISAYECVTDGNVKFDNNLDDFTCLGSDFGKGSKDEGEFSGEGELTVKWNTGSKPLIGKWITGSADGTAATSDSFYAELLIIAVGKKIGTYTDGSETKDFNKQFIMYMPKIEITKAWSDLSGNETKTIDIEFSTVANSNSTVHMEIDSTFEKLSNEPFITE